MWWLCICCTAHVPLLASTANGKPPGVAVPHCRSFCESSECVSEHTHTERPLHTCVQRPCALPFHRQPQRHSVGHTVSRAWDADTRATPGPAARSWAAHPRQVCATVPQLNCDRAQAFMSALLQVRGVTCGRGAVNTHGCNMAGRERCACARRGPQEPPGATFNTHSMRRMPPTHLCFVRSMPTAWMTAWVHSLSQLGSLLIAPGRPGGPRSNFDVSSGRTLLAYLLVIGTAPIAMACVRLRAPTASQARQVQARAREQQQHRPHTVKV